MGRVLGVDLGTRRVGLALTDPGRAFAFPLATIPFESESKLAERLRALCGEHGVDLVVVGLPVSVRGDAGARESQGCARSRRMVERLQKLRIACETWDESWSSREAAEALRQTGWKRSRDPGKADAAAAALVLRDWLEHHP